MYAKIVKCGLILSPIFIATISFAGQFPQVMTDSVKDPASVVTYWTSERMQNAKPMDLPMADANAVKKISFEEMNAIQKSLPSIIHEGSEPTIKFVPNTRQLFKPLQEKLNTKLDAGGLKQHFSSQPLIPVTSSLFYPYSAVGKIFFSTPNGDKTCTAYVVNKRTVVTAAHCFHSGVSGTPWYGLPVFVPAYRDGQAPLLTWNANYRVLYSNWITSGGTVPSIFDYAVFTVADQVINGIKMSVGDVTGSLGYKTNSTLPNHAHILGYPGNLDSGQGMHQVTSQSAMAVDPGNVEYGSDMNIGAGGGPMIQNFGPASTGTIGGSNPDRNMVVATISYGYADTVTFGNGGVIVSPGYDFLVKYPCTHAPNGC